MAKGEQNEARNLGLRRARDPALRNKATRQASTPSGGEQKQLEIARGLLLNPRLVLMDECSTIPASAKLFLGGAMKEGAE